MWGLEGADPHAIDNAHITFDSTVGPLHMWIQPIMDGKQSVWSAVGKLWLGMWKCSLLSTVGWIHG